MRGKFRSCSRKWSRSENGLLYIFSGCQIDGFERVQLIRHIGNGSTAQPQYTFAPAATTYAPAASFRGDSRMTRPAASGAPRISTSDRKPAMLRGGKLQTQETSEPTSSS